MSELTGLWLIYYHALYKEIIGICYNNKKSCGQKIYHSVLCVSYQIHGVINYHALFPDKLSGCVTTTLFLHSYHRDL